MTEAFDNLTSALEDITGAFADLGVHHVEEQERHRADGDGDGDGQEDGDDQEDGAPSSSPRSYRGVGEACFGGILV